MAWFLTGLLFFSITGTLADAECHCSTATACAVFPSTPCSQVGYPDRCQEGWFGSHCQRRNIALGRTATQSSTYSESSDKTGNTLHRFDAWYAVDGRSTTDFYSKPLTCTHTLKGVETWTVYLNNSNTDKIQHVKLYLRQDFQDRNNGMKIYVCGQLCFQWSRNTHPPAVADVKCQQALAGNNLTIHTNVILTLCEVQIFGSCSVCSDGWFGEDCDKQCHCSLNTEVCDKITGQCLSGCAPGYMGTDCQTVCPDGYYGDCTSKCGSCLNADYCDKTTGICPGGCAAGWRTDTCLQPCADGYYGDCISKCGNCFNAAYCDKDTGTCPGGCAAGWLNDTCLQRYRSPATEVRFLWGNCVDGDVCIKTNRTCSGGFSSGWFKDKCNQPCPDGRYGAKCASPCGHCRGSDVCDRVTGACPGGCQPGWWPDLCSQACSDGRHGHHCQSECGQCEGNLPCNKNNGTCDQGCLPGFQEPFCKECVDGMYGVDCMSRCGQCKDGLTCDKSSGECPGGCKGNFMQPLCQGCAAGFSHQVVPVAATLGTLLVLSLIALLTAIIYNRRLKIQLDASQKKPEDNYISLDERTKDLVVENTYEHIDNTTPSINAVEVLRGRI